MKDKIYCLYPSVFLTKGAKKAIIFDLFEKEVLAIGLNLFNKLEKRFFLEQDISEQEKSVLLNYGLIFESNTKFNDHQCILSNDDLIIKGWQDAILVIPEYATIDSYRRIFLELDELTVKYIQIRFEYEVNFFNLSNWLALALKSNFVGVEVWTAIHEDFLNKNKIVELLNTDVRSRLVFWNCDNKVSVESISRVVFKREKLNAEKTCGKIEKANFQTNIDFVKLALQKNSCLFGKIGIDRFGNIKNCPSCSKSYGNIKDKKIRDCIKSEQFKKYANISKDKILVCKDCEYRYVCMDCRAYRENPADILSKPLKCGYNPYTGEWSEWSTNPLKQKAIKYYDMQELELKEESEEKLL